MSELAISRRRWIDALLVVAGVALFVIGQPFAAIPVLALGLVMPAVHWVARHRGAAHGRSLTHLVPPDLAASYADVFAAARLAGVTDTKELTAAADNILLEVAAILAGRHPSGGAQKRFIATRVRALNATVAELRERHEAWMAARAEVDAISALELPEPPAPGRDGVLVGILVVVLFPVFAAWDLVRATGRGLIAVIDGVALRVRTAGRLAIRVAQSLGTAIAQAARRCAELRTRITASAREARHRFIALRLRVRMRLRNTYPRS